MKNDLFTKTTLALIAAALVVIASQGIFKHTVVAHAASTQRAYDYKFLLRSMRINSANGYVGGTATWTEDAHEPPNGYNDDDGSLGARMRELGKEGWDLVADVTYSNQMNVNYQ